MRKTAFIIGAGASRAISPEIPLMNNFFSIAERFAKDDKNIKTTLDTLQKYKAFGDINFRNANLEDVMGFTMQLPRNQNNPWARPYDGLLLTLHKIFYFLDREYMPFPFIKYIEQIKDYLNNSVAFISFNYDVFLERALHEVLGWQTHSGYYPNVLVGIIDTSQADSAQAENVICDEVYAWSMNSYDAAFPDKKPKPSNGNLPIVIKPHGSLNWFIHPTNKNPYFWIPNCTGFLLMGPDKERPTISKYWTYGTTNSVEGEFRNKKVIVGGVLSAIVPPGKKFAKKIKTQIFNEIYKEIVNILSEVSNLVIIGWSMTGFDKHYKGLFNKIRKNRKQNKLKKFLVCDYKNSEKFYERFEKLIPNEKFLSCNKGFGSVEFLNLLEEI